MVRKLLGILIASIFLIIVSFQLDQLKAFAQNPVSGPITNPITSPLMITGTITYHNLEALFKHLPRFFPGADVTVTATDLFTNIFVSSTTTDANGMYILPIPQPGLYTVKASDASNTFFVPPFHVVHLTNKNKQANFQGLLF